MERLNITLEDELFQEIDEISKMQGCSLRSPTTSSYGTCEEVILEIIRKSVEYAARTDTSEHPAHIREMFRTGELSHIKVKLNITGRIPSLEELYECFKGKDFPVEEVIEEERK
jgi:hypothetical protein